MPYCNKCGEEVSEDDFYCRVCGASLGKTTRETISVMGEDLLKKVKDLIKEGNVTMVIVKSEDGKTLLVMPATVGVVGTILAPWAAALGAAAALATKCTIEVERRAEPGEETA